MKTSFTFRLVSAALVVYFGSSMLADAQNENVGFSRTTLAIGTVTNRMVMEGLGRGADRDQPGGAEAIAILASKKLNPDQKKEIHAYAVTVLPGGHSNWHSHPGLEMASNPATAYPVSFHYVNRDGSCRKEILAPGQSPLIMPGEVHTVINESAVDVANFIVLRVHTGDSREFLPVESAVPNPDFVPVTIDEQQPQGEGCPVF
jgi:quercetin dioxygenase-like cupin family protein